MEIDFLPSGYSFEPQPTHAGEPFELLLHLYGKGPDAPDSNDEFSVEALHHEAAGVCGQPARLRLGDGEDVEGTDNEVRLSFTFPDGLPREGEYHFVIFRHPSGEDDPKTLESFGIDIPETSGVTPRRCGLGSHYDDPTDLPDPGTGDPWPSEPPRTGTGDGHAPPPTDTPEPPPIEPPARRPPEPDPPTDDPRDEWIRRMTTVRHEGRVYVDVTHRGDIGLTGSVRDVRSADPAPGAAPPTSGVHPEPDLGAGYPPAGNGSPPAGASRASGPRRHTRQVLGMPWWALLGFILLLIALVGSTAYFLGGGCGNEGAGGDPSVEVTEGGGETEDGDGSGNGGASPPPNLRPSPVGHGWNGARRFKGTPASWHPPGTEE